MSKLFNVRNKRVGLPPGSIVFTGEHRTEPVTLSLLNYSESSCQELHDIGVEQCEGLDRVPPVSWVNVSGVHDVALIERLGSLVSLHPLVMEDLAHLNQRPKVEAYDSYVFIVLKMLHYDEDRSVRVEQVSLVVSDTFVVCFQEYAGDVFEPVRERIRNGKGRIRKMGADYLAYAIMDTVVDHYFVVLEKIGAHVEEIEEAIFEDADQRTLRRVNHLKREVALLRKSIWPLREVISALERSESPVFKKKTEVYLRDLYDHTIQVIDILETMSELLSSLTELYISSQSMKMNEVMQFLTIVGTIFIPLTFIAGVYGMNFVHMPELHWRFGYPLVILIMLLIGSAFLVYFKRKKWL